MARGFVWSSGVTLLALVCAACSDPPGVIDTCPNYSAPLCESGQTLGTGVDQDNCPMPVCVPCPEPVRPQCEAWQTLSSSVDVHGCPVWSCTRSCPLYAYPHCAEGQTVETTTDEYGCVRPHCVG
ncbi:MAG TPA: hypothetical protein VKP30_27455 [Polyangiaceae bacterium]|nr:hypothetical protein [Polyangiaceae bacterium]